MVNKTTYSDSPEKSSEFFRMAVTLLSKYKIPVDPHNYQMGYEYAAGRNQAFIDDLNQLIESHRIPSEKQLDGLYKQYFVQDEACLEIMRKEIRHIISSILNELGYSDNQLSQYSTTLNQFADILDKHSSSENLYNETQKVIEETHSMEQSQKNMERQISSVMVEIDSLRKELDQVKEESKIDTLTGIANRKTFDAAIERAILTSREKNNPLSLMILDIDHFKKFNDTFGHLVGDKVLRYTASSLKRNIKGNDLVARFGGEEFVIILPTTSINGAVVPA